MNKYTPAPRGAEPRALTVAPAIVRECGSDAAVLYGAFELCADDTGLYAGHLRPIWEAAGLYKQAALDALDILIECGHIGEEIGEECGRDRYTLQAGAEQGGLL